MAWWNPVSWAQDAGNDFQASFNAVKSWVITQVRNAVNDVERDISDIGQSLNNYIQDVENVISDAYSWAQQAESWIAHSAATIWNDVASDVQSVVNTGIRDLEVAGGWIDHEINSLINNAVNDIERAGGWIDHNVINPVESFATGLYNDVKGDLVDFETTARGWVNAAISGAEHYADVVWQDAYNDVVKPLDNAFQEAASDLGKVEAWVYGDVAAGIHLVEEAWDWLELFAAHGLSTIENLPQEILAGLSPAAINNYMANELAADVKQAGQWVEEFFQL